MKKLFILVLLGLCTTAYSEVGPSNGQENGIRLDVSICATEQSRKAEVEFYKRYNGLIEYLFTNKEKINSVGMAVDPSVAINKIKESHNLWLKSVTLDCEIWAFSPLNSGSRNDDEQGCWCTNFISRVEKIEEYEKAWVGKIR